MTDYLVTAAVSYLLGSIPFGYILVQTFRGQDIRQSGSGNIGATNVARSSPALGLGTLLLDSGKGLAAVTLTRFLYPGQVTLGFLAALFAVIGHIFPFWLRFRGGKGVATGLGSFLMLAPKAIAMVIAIFVVVLVAFRRVSLASIVAVASLPVLTWLFYRYGGTPLGLMACACLLVIVKHHENIRRLLSGNEPRFQLRRG
ncbi:MAG TPA: glycerol-3-phosphate 1-O-acyltransferase PlsY [Terriglobales bacterium]|nr:glycerol-3-phosphate 1-O-acyltransferase PlsY [Terriglobales bacterium]